MIVLQIIVFLPGLGIALLTLQSAIKQTVLPGARDSTHSYPISHNL